MSRTLLESMLQGAETARERIVLDLTSEKVRTAVAERLAPIVGDSHAAQTYAGGIVAAIAEALDVEHDQRLARSKVTDVTLTRVEALALLKPERVLEKNDFWGKAWDRAADKIVGGVLR